MKKTLTFLLSLAFLASVMVTPSFAETQTDAEELLKQNAASSLQAADFSMQQQTNGPSAEIQAAYQRVVEEEQYIVSLINGLSESETTTDNWEYNLQFLKDNYDTIQEKSTSQDINMDYVNSYIEAYENVLAMKDAPEEKVPSTSGVTANVAFSPTKAINYANSYWYRFNPAYPNWTPLGGDCANFVSQCLYAGGYRMEGIPGTTSASKNYNNWFSKGRTLNTKNVSLTWRSAASFRNYWQKHAVGYKKFSSFSNAAYYYGYRGSAVSLLLTTGRAYHTMLIVGYKYDYDTDLGDLIYADHSTGTNSTNSGSLRKAGASTSFIIYRTYR